MKTGHGSFRRPRPSEPSAADLSPPIHMSSASYDYNYVNQVRTKWAAGPFAVFMTPVFTECFIAKGKRGKAKRAHQLFVAIPGSDLRIRPHSCSALVRKT